MVYYTNQGKLCDQSLQMLYQVGDGAVVDFLALVDLIAISRVSGACHEVFHWSLYVNGKRHLFLKIPWIITFDWDVLVQRQGLRRQVFERYLSHARLLRRTI